MSRSGYSDACDGWELIMWRGAVKSALRGKRGQAFLRELIAALDELPEKKLAANVFASGDCVCALGAVARARGTLDKCRELSEYDLRTEEVGQIFGIARAMAAEIMHVNDEGVFFPQEETDEARWKRMRRWAENQLAQGVEK